MAAGMGVLEAEVGDVGVDLGGGEELVAQLELDGTDVGTVVQHDGGAGMAEGVGRAGLADVSLLDVAMDDAAQAVGDEGFAPAGEEDEIGDGTDTEKGTGIQQVAVNPGQGALPDGNAAVMAAFAVADGEHAAFAVQVGKTEGGQFAAAEPGGIKGFQQGAVTQSGRRVQVRLAEHGFGFAFRQDAGGEFADAVGATEVGGGADGNESGAERPAEKGAEAGQGAALGSDAEGGSVSLAVGKELPLVAFQVVGGDGIGADQVAGFGPEDKAFQILAANPDGGL